MFVLFLSVVLGITQSISYGPADSKPDSSSKFTPILKEGSAGITDTGTTLVYLVSSLLACVLSK